MKHKSTTLLPQFEALIQTSQNEFSDLQVVNDPEKKLAHIIGTKSKSLHFQIIARSETDSFIAFWKSSKEINFISSPIAWLSGEGFPTSVIASSFEEFLSLLPYGTGFIYDFLSSYYFHQQSPNLQPNPKEKFTLTKCKSYLKENKKQYKGHDELIGWLTKQANIPVADNPVAVIEQAILDHPDLASWLKE